MKSTMPIRVCALSALFLLGMGCGRSDLIKEARELQDAGSYEASLEVLREHLEDVPRDPEARYLYGLALSGLGRPSQAQWSLREAMRDEAWAIPAAIAIARDALSTGNYYSGLDAANEILARDEANVDGLYLRTVALIMSRKTTAYESALADADRLLEIDPDHRDAGVLRAVALLGLERIDDAEIQLVKSAENTTNAAPGIQALYCVTMVEFFDVRDEKQKAKEELEKCKTSHPKNGQVLAKALEYYDAQGEADQSLALLEETLAQMPGDLGVRSGLAQRLYRAGKTEEAEQLMLGATALPSGQALVAALLELNSFYRSIGRPLDSAEALARAVEILGSSPPPQIALRLVETWVEVGDFEAATEAASQISEPTHRAFADATIAVFQDDYARALERFSDGYATWPNNAAARYYGGYAAEQLGLFQRAIDEYRHSIRSGPGVTDARERLARLFLEEGEVSMAYDTIMVDAHKSPLSSEGMIIAIELAARLGRTANLNRLLNELRNRPEHRARAVAAVGRAIAARRGPVAGAKFIEESEVDLTNPIESEAVRTLVMLRAKAGNTEGANEAIRRALMRAPGAAAFHEIRGLLLEQYSANRDLALATYSRALEIDPKQARALAGKARLEFLAGDLAEATNLLGQAHSAAPQDGAIARAYAAALVRDDRAEEGMEVLERTLNANPLDGRAALQMGRLLAESSPEGAKALAFAERATRFHASAASLDFLADCLEARDSREEASAARKQADTYRPHTSDDDSDGA